MSPADQQNDRPIIAARLAALDDEAQSVSPNVSIGRLLRLDAMQH